MLGAILGGASLLGSILGKAGAGQSAERGNQNDYQLRQNALTQQGHQFDMQALLQALAQNESATMDRAKLGISAPRDRARQALLGSLLSNAQTARISAPAGINVGQVSGGLDISKLLSGARQAGSDLTAQATRALQTGSDIPAYTDATSRLTSSPTPAGYKKAGLLESILSGAGGLGALAGGINLLRKPQGGGSYAAGGG